jgi:hypothetical protein
MKLGSHGRMGGTPRGPFKRPVLAVASARPRSFPKTQKKGIQGESVAFNPTGCETLTGLGANRWIEPQPGFYATLVTALGLHDASRSTFVCAVIDPPLTGVTRGPAGTALDPFSPRAGAPAPGPSR